MLNAGGEGLEEGERPAAVTEEELEKLSAFSDFIEELDLDDLGESKTAGE